MANRQQIIYYLASKIQLSKFFCLNRTDRLFMSTVFDFAELFIPVPIAYHEPRKSPTVKFIWYNILCTRSSCTKAKSVEINRASL